ncbi:hypothetical protein Tco_1185992 [Tanacetum coccineum]
MNTNRLAYALSMSSLLSLPLSIACDDGCSYCRFDVGLHEAMMSLGVGKLKDEVICTLARQLTEVAAMAYVLRFATLLSLYVGVLSLPAQRRSSRLWKWDQVLAQNVPHGSSHSVSDIVDTFFKKSHPDQGGDNKKDMLQKAIVQPVSTSAVNVGVAIHLISNGLNELTRSSEEGRGAEKGCAITTGSVMRHA